MDLTVFFDWEFAYFFFYIVTVLWIAEFIIFPSKQSDADYEERKTFKLILSSVLFTVISTIILTAFSIALVTDGLASPLRIIGMIAYAIGIILRYVSTITLGRYFTRDVQVSQQQELIAHGPYRYLRHPLYLGLFLLIIGVPLFFGNWLILLVAGGIAFVILNTRMRIEEANMERVLGDKYRAWKKQRYRFIPFIY